MIKGKKALSMQGVLISLIIAAIILLILLAWFNLLPFNQIVDKEACHQTVLMRSAQTPVIGTALRKTVPLKCQTENILIDYKDEEKIKERMANAMYDCWWMLGEGKLNFFSSELTRKNYCIICSNIRFKGNAINREIDLYDYLKETDIPMSDEKYIEYLSDGSNELLGEVKPVDTNKEYAVVFSFFKGEMLSNLIAGTGGALVGAKAGAVIGSIVPGVGTIVGGSVGLLVGGVLGNIGESKWKTFISGSDQDYFASMYLIEYDKDSIENIGCTSIESIP